MTKQRRSFFITFLFLDESVFKNSLKDLSNKYQLNQKQYDYMLEKMICINDIKNLK